MSLILFAHPFASYCQKALIALYENGTPFTFRMLDKSDFSTFAEVEALWPLKRLPLLLDEGRPIAGCYDHHRAPRPARMLRAGLM
jgi:glutathione S-transferase